MEAYVYDLETMHNFFCAVFIDYKTDTIRIFTVHKLRNNFQEFIEFLEDNKNNGAWHIGFNNLAFDSQVIQAILVNKKKLLLLQYDAIIDFIYAEAQKAISKGNSKEWAEYPEWKLSIQQIDVYKINHWDNANKRTSLKWAEYSIDWDNIQEMPIHHSTLIHTIEEIDMITQYCINDVLATKKVLYLSKPLIEVRTSIKNKYGLKCYNFSNTKLGSELLLKLYCDSTGKVPYEVKQYRTHREVINIKDIMFPYISFQSQDLIGFHQMLKSKVIRNTKKDFTYTLNWMGSTFYYGAGGIHQCIKTGIYLADEDNIIEDIDVQGLYPNIACQNGMYPAHLGKEFFEVYRDSIVGVRNKEKSKPKEQRDMAIIEGFKEAANATYGNSNSQYSWLFDSSYTMQTTINGQLLITMLVEDLILHIPELQLLQTNTDGTTIRFNKKYREKYLDICKKWEEKTKLTLEYVQYKSMFIWDVNNYISVKYDNTTKCKGRFEWEDLEKYKYTHLHKNKSHLIIAKAIFNYFVNNIPPEKYLAENRNIFDYCGGVKTKSDWEFQETCVVKGQVQRRVLQKVIRYYISNTGCKIIKVNKQDKREIQIESGAWMQTEFSKYEKKPWEDYNVNDSYYLERIYQEINNIVPKPKQQLEIEF